MIPLERAQAAVLERVAALPPLDVAAADALGLVLAAPVIAAEDVPPFANTAMDGFAVRAADTGGAPVRLRIAGTLAAGADPSTVDVAPGTAVRIMTGAPMPSGADAVVMVERTTVEGDDVVVAETAAPGQFVRRAGEDVAAGSVVFGPGTELRAGHLGVLAAVGVGTVSAHPRPRVGVLSTGDELVDTGGPLGPGQIRDSNRATLLALVREAGCDAVDLGIVRDEREATTAAIETALASCDVLLTSGGVSMGEFDYVKAYLDTWVQVAIKPAKPLAFGTVDGRLVLGLPGNPVSALVSFELFGRPALRRLAGHPEGRWHRPRLRAVAGEAFPRRPDGKTHLVRVVTDVGEDGELRVGSAGGQGSHMLHATATADALAVVPDGDGIAAGDTVDVLLLARW